MSIRTHIPPIFRLDIGEICEEEDRFIQMLRKVEIREEIRFEEGGRFFSEMSRVVFSGDGECLWRNIEKYRLIDEVSTRRSDNPRTRSDIDNGFYIFFSNDASRTTNESFGFESRNKYCWCDVEFFSEKHHFSGGVFDREVRRIRHYRRFFSRK